MVVVFDGHQGTSAKDMTHCRWAGGRTGATITIIEDTLFYNAWRIPCKQHKQAAVHQHSQQSPTDFCEQSTVFDTQSASTADVVSAWENAASLCLNNGRPREGLDSLRHKHFCEKVATSTSQVEPQSLPPTSAAAKHHSFCVYYQVQRKENCRWKMKGHLPWTNWVTNQLIWCTCKRDCSTLRRTCKWKHDSERSVACRNCKGSRCANSSWAACDDEDETLKIHVSCEFWPVALCCMSSPLSLSLYFPVSLQLSLSNKG